MYSGQAVRLARKSETRHIDVVEVGAGSKILISVHSNKHQKVANQTAKGDYSHCCCEENRNGFWAPRVITGIDLGGIVHCDKGDFSFSFFLEKLAI